MPPTAVRRTSARSGTTPRAPLADLCAEARRLAHRRCRAEAAARRFHAHPAQGRVRCLAAHSDRLLIGFHRVLDRIRAADGFDEALAIFRDYRAELGARLARPHVRLGTIEQSHRP